MKSGITWRRTFPECAPGTDGVALFEGARHRPGAAPGRAAARPEALDVERHRPDPRRTARLGRHAGRSALAPASHGPPDRTLAGAASAQADLRSPAWCAGEVASACRGPEATTSAQPASFDRSRAPQ